MRSRLSLLILFYQARTQESFYSILDLSSNLKDCRPMGGMETIARTCTVYQRGSGVAGGGEGGSEEEYKEEGTEH